ncbi:retinoic acid early transcript 1E-like isoform X1 [Dama dama]|uniref:retinoic acid early transcript 1E-like isoform X1 n=1 Tax=Dama dama TaxID=30532 RepID=UPI002A370AFE|nr:retinoic acid early transcript 1E-like isoform X1 [Dama dama]XP_060986512.1 retinoic acid early transcript 1E-like isoform X1 [Dama dama]XP_060986513.1 retinoic acid early transcript 1E-like isoform X1 [Dama dama]XP_060986514.1 retinoic acid early transcript 1E-like isoform X1 [Dama dama]XP_060986515.1 retinoic acid early transcript 1E-like isoform X1 [Dama dama]XP_060986516.1 retinoic acid early transcript 1E-like isoform X1 [Dama dama]XP_060986517.1 retinoic acid early transcript 1E-like
MLLKLQGGKSLAHTTGHLLLTLLLTEAGKTLGNAHSLCLDLTVKKQSRPGQPWCQVQGSVDTKPFLQCDSDSHKVRPLGFLGEEVNDTKAWTELSQMVGEARRELRMVLPVIKLDKKEMRGPPSLQVRLCCQREAEQCSGASLLFSLNGQTALLLDTMSITWTGIDPGATGLKEEWENSQELAEYFRKISVGDCSYWLREFLEHWENMLLPEPTEPLIMAPRYQPVCIRPIGRWYYPIDHHPVSSNCFTVMNLMKKSGTTAGERNVDTDRRDRYRETRPMGRVSWKDRNRHELRNAKGFRQPQSCPRYLRRVRLFAAPWTAAHQAPLSVGFFRQEYWGGLPFPSPCNHQ